MRELLFFRAAAPISLATVAELGGAELPRDADPTRAFTMVASLDLATSRDVSTLGADDDIEALQTTNAGACFVASHHRAHVPPRTIPLVTPDPLVAFARVAALLCPESAKPGPLFARGGLDPTAVVHSTARLELGVILDPGVIVGPRAEIGTGTAIGAHTTIGAGVRIGRGCAIDPHVSIAYALIGDHVAIHAGARIGQGGPGLDASAGSRATHLGRVIIQNDVEIGANVVIERGLMGDTIIGDGTRIAAQASIGPGTKIDRHLIVEGGHGPSSVSTIRKMS